MNKSFDIAVVIGRFQPFHHGHAALLKRALDAFGTVHFLFNSAGAAIRRAKFLEIDDALMEKTFDLNVKGTLYGMQAVLPHMLANKFGVIVNVGSTAAHHVYAGGAGYTAAKHGARAVTATLRGELLGRPVRVIEVDPGMVETEFSEVRFGGDTERAAAVYAGLVPLSADDVADAITWAATRPSHVNVDSIVLTPRDQVVGFGMQVHRSE